MKKTIRINNNIYEEFNSFCKKYYPHLKLDELERPLQIRKGSSNTIQYLNKQSLNSISRLKGNLEQAEKNLISIQQLQEMGKTITPITNR